MNGRGSPILQSSVPHILSQCHVLRSSHTLSFAVTLPHQPHTVSAQTDQPIRGETVLAEIVSTYLYLELTLAISAKLSSSCQFQLELNKTLRQSNSFIF